MNIENIKEFLRQANDKELYNLTAKLYKTALDALMENGFSREESFQLLITMKIGQ